MTQEQSALPGQMEYMNSLGVGAAAFAIGKAYFRAFASGAGAMGFDLYVSDGTVGGTKRILGRSDTTSSVYVQELKLTGSSGTSLFVARDPTKGSADMNHYLYALTPGLSLPMAGLNPVKVLSLGTPSIAPNTVLTAP